MDSVISRSQSLSSSTTINKDLIEGTYGFLDTLFPIYEQISKIIHTPILFNYLTLIIICIQIFSQSLWARKTLHLTTNRVDDTIIRKLYEYFLLNDPTAHYTVNMIGFYVVISVFAAAILLFFTVLIQYKVTISFNKPLLYIYRCYFDVVVPCFLLPTIGFAGQFLSGTLHKELPFVYIVLAVIAGIIASIEFAIYYFHFSLLSSSPYLGRGPFATFRGKYYTDFMLTAFIFEFITYIFELFPKWASIIGCFAEAAVFIYFASIGADLPYLDFKANAIFSGIFTTIATVNIIQGIQGIYFLADIISLIAFPVVLIASSLIYFFVYRSTKYKIKKFLSNLPEDRENMSTMSEEFDNNRMDSNANYYIKHVMVALESVNEVFINNLIFKYGYERYAEPELNRVLLIYAAQIPSFNRILSFGYSNYFRSVKLTFLNRFLIYTILRLVTMRQSSSSQQFSQRVIEVRQLSKRCRDYVRGFLMQTPSKVSSFYTFYKEAIAAEYRWTELINHYPNSSKVYDEYGDFLIEVMTDFHESTIQKHKTTLLEDGHRLHKDHVFINFIHWYQHYLKRGIVDMHGKIIDQRRRNVSNSGTNTSSKSGSNASSLTSLTQLLEIAPEEEEFYAKALFAQHKLRLAYQRAIEERQSPFSKPLKICAFLICAFSIAVMIVSDTIVNSFFETRASSISKVMYINRARFFQSCARFSSLLYFATQKGYYTINDNVKNKAAKDKDLKPYISFTSDFRNQSLYYNQQSEHYYNLFISEIINYANSGHNVYHVASPFLTQSVKAYFCTKDAHILENASLTNVHTLFSYNNIANAIMYTFDVDTWHSNKILCNTVTNMRGLVEGLDLFNENELNYENEDTLENSHKIEIMELCFPLALFAADFLLLIVTTTCYYFNLKRILKVLQSIQPKIKEESCKTIGKSNSDDQSAVQPPESMIFVYVYIWGIISLVIVPIFAFVEFNEAKSVNKKFESLIGWMNLGGARCPLLSEAMEHLTLAALTKAGALTFTHKHEQLELAESLVAEAMHFHEVVSEGTNITEPCYGFDSILDALHYENICIPNQESTEIHERYRCASLSQSFGFVKSILDDIVVRFDDIENMDDPIYTEIFHLTNTHMFRKIVAVTERLDYLGQEYKRKFELLAIIITVIGIIASIFLLMSHMFMAYQLDHIFEASMMIFRRIPPLLITQNHELMDFLLNRQRKGSSEAMTFSQNIIFSSQNGVLLVNKTGIVESVNDSVIDILGYVPDQILGQQASIIFSEKDAPKVIQQLQLMHDGEAKDVFDDHFECITDDNTTKQCHVTILALASQGQGEINTYVFFIEDESQILHKQEQAELAKKKSEELLFQILPRDIVFKLNQGEKDITFTVPSATIMFIDIVRFSDYAANLTPQQIMGNLSLIFDTFDKHLTEYPLITKIKLIGDVYMCAAGLFNPDGQPQDHAQQMLRFAIDCLAEIENINVALESMLSVRVGVNTGGPLIGGILGTDKPVFDIIGDPINVAARLQSTDIPGKVQIPQSVYDLVHAMEFNIEKRGEVYLKGKGNVTTYLVSPVNIFNMASNNITSSMCLMTLK